MERVQNLQIAMLGGIGTVITLQHFNDYLATFTGICTAVIVAPHAWRILTKPFKKSAS